MLAIEASEPRSRLASIASLTTVLVHFVKRLTNAGRIFRNYRS